MNKIKENAKTEINRGKNTIFRKRKRSEEIMRKNENMIQITISAIEYKKRRKLLKIAKKIAKSIHVDEDDMSGGLLY